jgi:hypothetical protein
MVIMLVGENMGKCQKTKIKNELKSSGTRTFFFLGVPRRKFMMNKNVEIVQGGEMQQRQQLAEESGQHHS